MDLQEQLTFLRQVAHDLKPIESADDALSLIKRGNPFDTLFFSEIDDPAWIPLLESNGFFRQIPDPIHHDDGSVSYPRSLTLHGLARLAQKAPESVARIIAQLPESPNLSAGDQLIRCMAEIRDASQVPVLLSTAKRLAGSNSRSTRLFMRELLKSWVELGRESEALEVMASFVDSVVRAEPTLVRDQQTAWELEECDRDILAPLAKTDPASVAILCFEALCALYEASISVAKQSRASVDDWLEDSAEDGLHLTYWLEDFKQSGLRRGDPGAILSRRLYSVLDAIYSRRPDERTRFDAMLRNHTWKLFDRLRWQLYADHPTETLDLAREDVLERLPKMIGPKGWHEFEFASMLDSQSSAHSHKFLSEAEVAKMVETVKLGPIDDRDEDPPTPEYRQYFWERQLWPIREILPEDIRSQLKQWKRPSRPNRHETELEDYKPFRSYGASGGEIRDKSPDTVEALAGLSDDELWNRLNTWKSTSRWSDNEDLTEETTRKLASTLLDLIESDQNRFAAATRWWEHLHRPVMLSVPLNRWSERLSAKDKDASPKPQPDIDLAAAFGVAERIVHLSRDFPYNEKGSEESAENPDWRSARLSAARFLSAYLRSPHRYDKLATVRELLVELASGPEWRLDRAKQSGHRDWQFEAINSVRGEAWEGILQFALNAKNQPAPGQGEVHPWILDLLTSRLAPAANESPAVYSFLGSKLQYVAYLAPQWLKERRELLFPNDRPEHQEAVVDGHLAYDRPHKLVIDAVPNLLALGLDIMDRRNQAEKSDDSDSTEHRRDVSSRLGYHIAFYTWNDWFAGANEGQRLLERYRSLASPSARSETLSYIGSVFGKAAFEEQIQPLLNRAQDILDDWLRWIQRSISENQSNREGHEAELGQLADLVAAECFPFEWRMEVASAALELISNPRWSFQLLDTLEQWSEQSNEKPERVAAGIHLLASLTSKLSDELRWSIQTKRLAPILQKGLVHGSPGVQAEANQIIDNLLQHGFFEFLDLRHGRTSPPS